MCVKISTGWKRSLKLVRGKFLMGDIVTAADTMDVLSVQFIFKRDLCAGRKVSEWLRIEMWLRDCEGCEGWKKVVRKTAYDLSQG